MQCNQWRSSRVSQSWGLFYSTSTPTSVQIYTSMYADDTKRFAIIDDNANLQNIDNISDWAEEMQLTFSADKCKILHIG